MELYARTVMAWSPLLQTVLAHKATFVTIMLEHGQLGFEYYGNLITREAGGGGAAGGTVEEEAPECPLELVHYSREDGQAAKKRKVSGAFASFA